MSEATTAEIIIRKRVNRLLLGEAWACFFLRTYVGMRLLLAGLTKFKAISDEGVVTYVSSENAQKLLNALGTLMKEQTFLGDQPALIDLYTTALPYVLIAVGSWVLVGWFSRLSLIAAGGTFLSLTFGNMLLPDDTESVYRGVELITVAGALALIRYNILAMDNVWEMINSKKSSDSSPSDSAPQVG